MFKFKSLYALCVGAFLFSGCATSPNQQSFYLGANIQIENAKVDTIERTISWQGTKPNIKTPWIGVSRTPLIGADYCGTFAPWFACRLGYFLDIGADLGMALNKDRQCGTFGLDYNCFGNVVLAGHFEQDADGSPLKFGGAIALVW